jgi:hypothetical protein
MTAAATGEEFEAPALVGTAFCNDYCVGARFAERLGWPGQPFRTRLGAVRWLLFDDGRGFELRAPDGSRDELRTPG